MSPTSAYNHIASGSHRVHTVYQKDNLDPFGESVRPCEFYHTPAASVRTFVPSQPPSPKSNWLRRSPSRPTLTDTQRESVVSTSSTISSFLQSPVLSFQFPGRSEHWYEAIQATCPQPSRSPQRCTLPRRTFLGPAHLETQPSITRRTGDLLSKSLSRAATFVKGVARSIRPKLARDRERPDSGTSDSYTSATSHIDQSLVPFVRSCVESRKVSTLPQSIASGSGETSLPSQGDVMPWWVELSLESGQDHVQPPLPTTMSHGTSTSQGYTSSSPRASSSVISSFYSSTPELPADLFYKPPARVLRESTQTIMSFDPWVRKYYHPSVGDSLVSLFDTVEHEV